MYSAQELVTQIESLASLPSVYIRIRETLDSPDGSMSEVAGVISADPALSARLLQVVNSALYGYGGKIDTLNRAVTILGLQQVHDLVLAMSIASVFEGIQPDHMNMNRFWRDSVLRGIAAREIGRRCGQPTAERLLVVGLLADLGHLVLYQTVPVLTDQARICSDEGGEPLALVEQRIIGCDFTEVGAALMDHWRLPACFAEIIGAQINPRLAGEFTYEAAMLHVAARIVEADRKGETSEEAANGIPPLIWTTLDLEPASFGGLREAAELNLAGYLALMFPRLSSDC